LIREAKNSDIKNIIKVCQDAHGKSLSSNVKLDIETLRKNIQVCILSKEHLVLVVEIDNFLEGAFIGVTHQLWYSRKKQATDLFFYVTEKGTGHGAHMFRRFIKWAKENRGVKEIMLGISSGIGDTDRTKRLYERMGAVKIGDNFVLTQE